MTNKEWAELCRERGIVVIDVNYKDMTYDEAVKCLDLLQIATDHAFKENEKKMN